MGKNRKNWGKGLVCLLVFCCLMQIGTLTSVASTIYQSDGAKYEEGYIIIGESHVVNTAIAYSFLCDDKGKISHLEPITYLFKTDDSLSVTEEGYDNTFYMSGNLFFVFEGNRASDGATQYNKEYIYSNGKGKRGKGVQKIHQIIKKNPQIAHWNIISYHGAVSSLEGKEAGAYYVESYQNWMTYEFPKADIYIMSHSTMTKYYKGAKAKANAFEQMIAKSFPKQYFDCTEFYNDRYPEGMADPDEKPDTIHWSFDTYVELFNRIITNIDQYRKGDCKKVNLVIY